MNTRRASRGYSLLEMIVSVGLFSVVMLVATSAYLALIDLDRKVRATNELVTNLSFAVDSMVRSIRTGTYYGCGSTGGAPGGTVGGDTGCPSQTISSFSFYDTNIGKKVTYKLMPDGVIGKCTGTSCASDSAFTGLTDPRINISTTGTVGLAFYLKGVGVESTGPQIQPQVIFVIKGTMPNDSKGGVTPFVIQTTATQRLVEF